MPRVTVVTHDFPEPDPSVITFADPRPSRAGSDVGIVAFIGYSTTATPGKEEPVDAICGAAVLSNFWDLSPGCLELTAPDEPGTPKTFRNAEAAFHALKFWKVGDSFALASASQVWSKFRKLSGNEDSTYSGFGSDWKAMMAVLTAKFASDPRLAAILLKTGDAFLLYHAPATGRDMDWSNNSDGIGQNLLGMQLMLVRDCFSGRDVWTEYLQGIVDSQTGIYLGPVRKQKWQDIVLAASIRVLDETKEREFKAQAPPNMPICSRRGCGRPIWNNQPDSNYCGTCREEMKREEAAALNTNGAGISSVDALRAIGDVSEAGTLSPLSAPSPPSLQRQGTMRSIRKEQFPLHQAVVNKASSVMDTERERERPQFHHSTTATLLPHSTTLASLDRDMTDMLFPKASGFAAAQPSKGARSGNSSAEVLSIYDDDEEHIDVNRPGILPTLLFACLWVGSTVAVLFAILWVYVYEGVRRHEDMATQAAVAHARLAVAELLGPAETVYKVLGAAFGGGAVANLSDYAGLARALTPHFAARPAIHEVELAGPPEDYEGSVHVAAEGAGVRLRTDRADCDRAGLHGCALEPMRTNSSSWYKTGFGVDNAKHEVAPTFFWHGPTYSPVLPTEPVCGDFCWRPTYAFVGRTRSGRSRTVETSPATITSTTMQPPEPLAPWALVRAGVDVQVLRTVVLTAEALCRCSALLTTSQGVVIAAADMAQTLSVANTTGEVQPARVWKLSYHWSPLATMAFVRKADSLHTFVSTGTRVSSWSLGGGPSDAMVLGSNLRIVLAVPEGAFYDAVLGPLVPWMTLTAIMPLATVILSTLAAGFLKCVVYGWRRHKEAILITSFRD